MPTLRKVGRGKHKSSSYFLKHGYWLPPPQWRVSSELFPLTSSMPTNFELGVVFLANIVMMISVILNYNVILALSAHISHASIKIEKSGNGSANNKNRTNYFPKDQMLLTNDEGLPNFLSSNICGWLWTNQTILQINMLKIVVKNSGVHLSYFVN